MASHVLLVGLLAMITCSIALASDESPLQDFCIADLNSSVLVNGYPCKDPKLVETNDFFFNGTKLPANTSNELGIGVIRATVSLFPGLNTLGISLARADFAPGGVNPPHTHPRASEILMVVKGSLEVGFVSSNPENRLFTKVMHEGELFVFPQGLVHFQHNVGRFPAVAIAIFNSQNPGTDTIANVVFGSKPAIPSDILAKSFQVNVSVIAGMLAKF